MTYGTNNTLFNGSAKEFVSAENNTDATYDGAYLRAVPKNITNKNQWGNIFIAPQNAVDAYASFTTVKVWIHVECLAATATISVANVSQTVTSNQWVQIEIPCETFVANIGNPFCGMNFANAGTWGITGIRIGEIVAE